jgi:hypothetical protein
MMQVLAGLPLVGTRVSNAKAPDLIPESQRLRFVLKSVISLGRAGVYAQALRRGRVVFVVRHPCGVVASRLRGMRLGKLEFQTGFETISNSRIGARYDLSVARLKSLSLAEQLTWMWLVMNEHALEGISGNGNAIVVTHEALCANPVPEAQRLFAFCELPWPSQTGTYLETAKSIDRTPSYYDLNRNSSEEIGKWKDELPRETIEQVQSILHESPKLRELFATGPGI